VRAARREARLRHRPLKIVRKLGATQFAALLRGVRDPLRTPPANDTVVVAA